VCLTVAEPDALADAFTLWETLNSAGKASGRCRTAARLLPALGRNTAAPNARWVEQSTCHDFSHPSPSSHVSSRIAGSAYDRRQRQAFISIERNLSSMLLRCAARIAIRSESRSTQFSGRTILSDRRCKVSRLGNWDYEGTCNSSRVKVSVDYGGRSAQLRYAVGVQSIEPPVTLDRAGFEVALGAGLGDWDFIVEENLGDSVALLSDLVRYVAELPRRLPEKWLKNPGA
jgi:hypothetical protein